MEFLHNEALFLSLGVLFGSRDRILGLQISLILENFSPTLSTLSYHIDFEEYYTNIHTLVLQVDIKNIYILQKRECVC